MLTDYIDRKTANVYGIYGHLGGGKTLTAVEIARWALAQGWSVTSNIFLFSSDLPGHYTFLEDFDSQDFWALPTGAPRGSDDPFRSVIIIDECAEFFDQFSSTSPVLRQFLSWLRHSSKRGQFVFLIVQQPEFIAKSLRLLIHKWIVCFDMYQYRLPGIKIKIPFTSHLVSRRIFDKYGNMISRGANFADKKYIGQFYNTAQSIATAGRTSDYHSTFTPYKPDFFYYLLIFSLCFLLLIFWQL